MSIRVTSEYGRLREAIMHRPGRELVRMTPSTRDYFLFDDLLYDEHARQEHDWLVGLLSEHLGVKIHLFDELLAESLQEAGNQERERLLAQVRQLEAEMPPVEQRVGQLEVLVRWFQGQGWPQYTQDPEADPEAAAPGSLPGSLAHLRPASGESLRPPTSDDAHNAHHTAYLHQRLTSWCAAGDFPALAEELVEGIESALNGHSPSHRPGPGQGHGHGHGHGPGAPSPLLALEDSEALRRFAEGRLFYLTPIPNLIFLNDVGKVVNERLVLSRMAAPGRAREPLLLDFVFRNHPRFRDARSWPWTGSRPDDPAWTAPDSLFLEGGNIIQLRRDLVLLGVGERTTMQAIQRLADAWHQHAVREGHNLVLYILRLPAGFNHLDGVLGLISPTECVVYPPVFQAYGPASVDVVRAELGAGPGPVRPTRSAGLFESLRADGVTLTPVPCGGRDPVDQQREQWFSAPNLLALAPGKLLIYRSAERTLAELAGRGYRIIDLNDVHTGAVRLSLDDEERWALKTRGAELSRGHGGPHSLVMPLVRDESPPNPSLC